MSESREVSEPRAIVVLEPGALTTVQDLGRPGHAHLGVPRSGALDEPAHRLANHLVGNPPGAATLETTLSGLAFRVTRAMTVAVTGAPCDVEVAGRARSWGAAVTVRAGDTVRVGPAEQGVRSVVAPAGGLLVEPVLGSRSTDLLSGLGPEPLRAGQVLPVGEATGVPVAVDQPRLFRRTEELRVRLGPRADWFEPDALVALDGATYRVGTASNRIGVRLEGAPVTRARIGELPSEGMVLGAVQVPPNGQPVVLLADHAPTGGYPVVGVVVAADVPGCAQLRPGEQVRLRLV